jgi:hypothetical protein
MIFYFVSFLGGGGQPRGPRGKQKGSSMTCSYLHDHMRLQLCRLFFFLYCRYELVMNLFVVVDFRAIRGILSSVDPVLGLCLLEV